MTKREKKKATVGGRISRDVYLKIRTLFPGGESFDHAWIRRRIDAALKRAVRERDKQWEAAGAFVPNAYRMMKKMLEVK